MAEIRHLENRYDSHYFCWGWSDWIKFRRLVQKDMSTAGIWSKSTPDAEFKCGRRLGEFSGLSSQSHLPHCRVLPLGEFTVMIPQPHATLQGAVFWWNQCHDRATLQGVRIPSTLFKIVFRHILFLSRCSWQRERLSALMLSICLFVCLSVCLSPKCKKRDFLKN